MAGGNKETQGQLPSNDLDVSRALGPRAEGLSAAEPSFQRWTILDLRVYTISLLCCVGARLMWAFQWLHLYLLQRELCDIIPASVS